MFAIGILFALPVMASTTASFTPSNINVTSGKVFTVSVSVNPQGTNNYAEKLEVNFPSSNLEVISFSLNSNWTALSQSGYDLTDNTNGVLVKTGGYSGGFSEVTTFGTITFRAKNSGSGIIKIGSNSLAFDAYSQTAIAENTATFVVSGSEVVPVKEVPVVSTKIVVKQTPSVPIVETAAVTETKPLVQVVETSEPTSNSLTATAIQASSGNYLLPWALFIILVIIIITTLIYRNKKNKIVDNKKLPY